MQERTKSELEAETSREYEEKVLAKLDRYEKNRKRQPARNKLDEYRNLHPQTETEMKRRSQLRTDIKSFHKGGFLKDIGEESADELPDFEEGELKEIMRDRRLKKRR